MTTHVRIFMTPHMRSYMCGRIFGCPVFPGYHNYFSFPGICNFSDVSKSNQIPFWQAKIWFWRKHIGAGLGESTSGIGEGTPGFGKDKPGSSEGHRKIMFWSSRDHFWVIGGLLVGHWELIFSIGLSFSDYPCVTFEQFWVGKMKYVVLANSPDRGAPWDPQIFLFQWNRHAWRPQALKTKGHTGTLKIFRSQLNRNYVLPPSYPSQECAFVTWREFLSESYKNPEKTVT